MKPDSRLGLNPAAMANTFGISVVGPSDAGGVLVAAEFSLWLSVPRRRRVLRQAPAETSALPRPAGQPPAVPIFLPVASKEPVYGRIVIYLAPANAVLEACGMADRLAGRCAKMKLAASVISLVSRLPMVASTAM